MSVCPSPWWHCAHCVVGVLIFGVIPIIGILAGVYTLVRLLA